MPERRAAPCPVRARGGARATGRSERGPGRGGGAAGGRRRRAQGGGSGWSQRGKRAEVGPFFVWDGLGPGKNPVSSDKNPAGPDF